MYKDEHEWTDEPTGGVCRVSLSEPPKIPAPVLAREIRRLAKREEDLERQLFATQQEREAYKTAHVQAEHREELWKDSAEKTGALVRKLEERTAALEAEQTALERDLRARDHQLAVANARITQLREVHREDAATFSRTVRQLEAHQADNQAKVLELAENAERIRELEEEVRVAKVGAREQFGAADRRIEALEKLAADRLDYITSFEPQARATGEENERLRAEIVSGDRELEATRERLRSVREENERLRAEVERLARDGQDVEEENRELRRRSPVFSGLAEQQRAHNVLVGRVEQLAQAMGKLDASTNPQGKPPAGVRLDSLEDSWGNYGAMLGNYGAMLTDHADRLKMGESRAEGLDLRVRDLHVRLSALEAGKE